MGLLNRFIRSFVGGEPRGDGRQASQGVEHLSASPHSEVDALLREGLLRHQAGDYQGSEAAFRDALRTAPNHADAHHLLGSLLGERERFDLALEHLRQAARLAPENSAVRADIGNAQRGLGQRKEAEQSYRDAIAMDADCVIAYRNLGDLLRERGRIDEAIENIREAARRLPEDANLQFLLADLLAADGQFLESTKSYQAGLRVAPHVAVAHNNLGASYRNLDRTEDAVQCFEEALRLDPQLADAHGNLGDILDARGDTEAAMDHFRLARESNPAAVHPRRRLGQMFLDRRLVDQSLQCFREVLALEPDTARSYFDLGTALLAAGQPSEAMERFLEAIRIAPDYADAYVNLGFACNKVRRLEEAAQHFRKAIQLSPEQVEAHNNLGGVLQLQGQLEPAMRAYERALELAPHETYIRSNLLTCMNYHADATPEAIYEQHLRWGERFSEPRPLPATPRLRQSDPPGRLRIGYVSADFCFHSVAFFIAPVIETHDRSCFEIFCYSNVVTPDKNTERLKKLSDHWRDISALNDDDTVAAIRRDGIDILVDLSGHTVGNRLPVFAQRPAPIQVTYLGYPNTTGLATMDYRLTDERADPIGTGEKFYVETLIRLPDCFLCFQPLASSPEVRAETGKDRHSPVTFASFNELLKITPRMVAAWSEILRRMRGSKLLIKGTAFHDPATREHVVGRFVAHGVEPSRLDLIGRTATLEEHLELYNRVDVALDTFPYNGTTTTCEALWMGVPVVSMAGQVHASRVGASLLPLVGLDDLLSDNVQAYVENAITIARDFERRQALRLDLRRRMRESKLMNASGFTLGLEAAYQRMWKELNRSADGRAEPPESGDGQGR